MRLLFAKPTYGPPADPCFDKSHRVALMHAAAHGVTWVGDVSPDRMGWAAARNRIVESALGANKEDHIDGVFWVDDDIMVPPNAIAKLTSYGLDFVSGLYFQRAHPFLPLFARLNKKMSFEWGLSYPEDVIAPCDGVGFGCCYTSLRMLRKVAKLCGQEGPFGGDFGKKQYGEDFTFCLRAREAGFRPHVDTSVKCEHHMGPEFSNEALFKQMYRRSNGKVADSDPQDDISLRQTEVERRGPVPEGSVQHRQH